MSKSKKKAPPPCPECGRRTVVPIIYGYPMPALSAAAERGEVALGGCCLGDDMPEWSCKSCSHEWAPRDS